MARQLTWLSDAERAKIEPWLPRDRKGVWFTVFEALRPNPKRPG